MTTVKEKITKKEEFQVYKTASSSRYLVKGNSIELRIYFPSGYSSASESFRAAQWLAPHAIRLKKNITLYSGPTSRPWIDSETVSDETLVLIMGNTERTNTPNHFSSSEMIKLPGEAINIKDMYRRCFKPPTQAEKILFTFKDLKGLPIAYISNTQCAIVCLWEGLSRGTETTDLSKTRKEYMDYVLVNFSERHGKMMDGSRKNLHVEMMKAKRKEYIDFVDSMFKNSISEIDLRIRTSQVDIDAHMKGIISKSAQIAGDNSFLQKLRERSHSEKIKKQLEADYLLISNLQESKKYSRFRFDSGGIIGTTNEIKLFGKYEIGKFDVTFYLNGRIRCFNLTQRPEDKYDHPHVLSGVPCYGNLSTAITKIINNHQFGVAFDLMYEFLQRYTDGSGSSGNGPYRKLEKLYPKLVEDGVLKICTNCKRIEDLCSCQPKKQACQWCGKSLEECVCRRCPKRTFPDNVIGHNGITCTEECDMYELEDGEVYCNY